MTGRSESLLVVENLSASYRRDGLWNPALTDITVDLRRGEVLGLVGESGSGKSTLGQICIGYRTDGLRLDAGHARFGDIDLMRDDLDRIRKLRGRKISFVPQNPTTSLNPSIKIAAQMGELLRHHLALDRAAANDRIDDVLSRVGLNASTVRGRYPHQLSGGQQQRVTIGMALLCRPELMILDEPTTGLDVTTQQQIIALLTELRASTGTAMLYITHDLALLSQIADRLAVMHKGRIVETGATQAILTAPQVAYTRQLIDAIPNIGAARREQPDTTTVPPPIALSLKDFGVQYRSSIFSFRGNRGGRPALSPLSFSVPARTVFGIVGESGSGKSTLAKAICGAVRRTSGSVQFHDEALRPDGRSRTFEQRRKIQYIYQNPDASLNPRLRIAAELARPLKYFFSPSATEIDRRIEAVLDQVRLPPAYGRRFPDELSGGERQRVAIARAFLAEPEILVCDEILSALDVTTQASIIDALDKLKSQRAVTQLFISHDLASVKQIAENVAVLFSGQLMQIGDSRSVYEGPAHPYTRALLDAVPRLGAKPRAPSAVDSLPGGPPETCAYFTRCPVRIVGTCDRVAAPSRPVGDAGFIRCHRTIDELPPASLHGEKAS